MKQRSKSDAIKSNDVQHLSSAETKVLLSTTTTVASYDWWISLRDAGCSVVLIFYRDCDCVSSAAYLTQFNEKFDHYIQLGFTIYGICSDYLPAIRKQHERLGLKFALLSCPENQLAHELAAAGIADVTVILSSRVGFPGGTIQPCVICTSGHRILYTWAASDPSCLSLTTNTTGSDDEWPSVDEVTNAVEDDLKDDAPMNTLTPTSNNQDDWIVRWWSTFISPFQPQQL